MNIQPLSTPYRDGVDQYIADEWAGPWVVTRGKMTDSRTLPGYVCVEDGELKGAILYHLENGDCEIAVLFSLAEGKGVASGLIEAVKNAAQRAGCRRLWLITTNDNTHAIRFYQKRGFTLRAVHINAMEQYRKLKPQLPLIGTDGIPIRDEFEFEIALQRIL